MTADGGVVVIDLETTGLGHKAIPPREDGIVQVGIAWKENGRIETSTMDVHPGEHLLAGGWADEAFKVNGFTRERAQKGKVPQYAANILRSQLRNLVSTEDPLMIYAYARAFDEGFQAQDPWSLVPPEFRWGPCVMELALHRLGKPLDSHLKLVDACAAFGVKIEGYHDAAHDAATAYRLLNRMTVEQIPKLRRIPFLEQFRRPLAFGEKTATSRNERYVTRGEWFTALGMVFECVDTLRLPLITVAEHHYQEEGFKDPQGFVDVRKEIHPVAGFAPGHMVWFTKFRRLR